METSTELTFLSSVPQSQSLRIIALEKKARVQSGKQASVSNEEGNQRRLGMM